MIVTADGRRYEGVTADKSGESDKSDEAADEEERFDSMRRALPEWALAACRTNR